MIKRISASVLLAFAVCLAACQAVPEQKAQMASPSPPSDPQADEASLKQFEKEWVDAYVKRDIATLDRVLADDWQRTGDDGAVVTKKQDLESVEKGTFVLKSYTFDPFRIRVYGDVAVINGGETDDSLVNGKEDKGHFRWTDVIVRKNGNWKAVSSQITRVK